MKLLYIKCQMCNVKYIFRKVSQGLHRLTCYQYVFMKDNDFLYNL